MRLSSFFALFILTVQCFSLSADIEAYQSYLDQIRCKYRVEGAAIAIVEGNSTKYLFSGHANCKGDKIHEKTFFQVGSITKTIMAWAFFHLSSQGRVQLNDHISKYLSSDIPSNLLNNENMTIKNLITLRSGILKVAYPGYDPQKESGESWVSIRLGDLPLDPSKHPDYCYTSGGHLLLEKVLKKITGKNFIDYVRKNILFPSGLFRSGFDFSEYDNTAVGYSIYGTPYPFFMYDVPSSAALISNAEEMSKFVRVHWNESFLSSLFDYAIYKEATKKNPNCYGMGYEVCEIGQEKMIYHVGTNRGWNALFCCVPRLEKGLVILTNSDHGHHLFYDFTNFWVQRNLGVTFPDMDRNEFESNLTIGVTLILLAFTCLILSNILLRSYEIQLQKKRMLLISFPSFLFILFWLYFFYTPFGWYLPGWTIGSYMPWGFHQFSFSLLLLVFLISTRFTILKNRIDS